jgi:hypothetical protein
MPRMLDLIRTSSVPATLMQAAARGALSVPPEEMIEIMVHLANHNKVFGQQARMTLAGWEEKSSLAAAANPNTPQEVLEYLTALENLRPRLLPALIENPSVSDSTLTVMATTGSREVVEAMRRSPRVQNSPAILHAITSNANATSIESAQLHEQLVASGFEESAPESEPTGEGSASPTHATGDSDAELDEGVTTYIAEHAKEIAAEADKPFQPLGGIHEFEISSTHAAATPEVTTLVPEPLVTATTAATGTAAAAAPAKPVPKKPQPGQEQERGSALQKISRLDIKGRIHMAMKGTKEERSILIRDSTKLIALAVLESPKITDGEVEKFASQKNVLEAVLRQIPMKRRFMKNYAVVRNLVANPRTPLDVSLGLMKNLLAADLRNLASNKEVPDTIRKLALKMFKQKSDTTKKSSM